MGIVWTIFARGILYYIGYRAASLRRHNSYRMESSASGASQQSKNMKITTYHIQPRIRPRLQMAVAVILVYFVFICQQLQFLMFDEMQQFTLDKKYAIWIQISSETYSKGVRIFFSITKFSITEMRTL